MRVFRQTLNMKYKAKINFFEKIFSTSQNSQQLDCSPTHQSCLECPLFFSLISGWGPRDFPVGPT